MKIGDNVFVGTFDFTLAFLLFRFTIHSYMSGFGREGGGKRSCHGFYLINMEYEGLKSDDIAGPNSTIQAISISSHVHIGNNCTIGPFVIIKENVKILPHTVIPANMVIASGSVIGGRPARVVGDVGEGWGVSGGGGGGLGVGGGGEEKWVEGGDLRELVRSIR